MKNNFRAYAASLAASASDSPALGRVGAPPFNAPLKQGKASLPLAPFTRKVTGGRPDFALHDSTRDRCRVMNKGETALQFLKRTTGVKGGFNVAVVDEKFGGIARDLQVVLILDWGGKAEDAETKQSLLQMAMGIVPQPQSGPGTPVNPREDWWNATREDILATSVASLLVDPKNEGYADAIKKGVANGAAVWLCARAASPFAGAQPQRLAKFANAPKSLATAPDALGTTYDGYAITDHHRWIASCSPSGSAPCAQLQYGAIAPFQVGAQTGALFIMDGVKYQDFATTYGVPYESIKVQKNWSPDHLIAFVPWSAAMVAHNTYKIPLAGQSTQVETNTPIQTGSTPGSSSQGLTQSSSGGTPPVKAACPRGWFRNTQGKCVRMPSTAPATPVRSNPFGTTKRPPKIGSVGAPMMPRVPVGGMSSTMRCQSFANANETLWQFANRIAPGPGGGKTKRLDEIAAWHIMIGGRLDSEVTLKTAAVAGVAMSGMNVPWWNASAMQILTGFHAVVAKSTGKPLPPGPYYGFSVCPPTISPLRPAFTKPMGVSGDEEPATVGDPSLDVEDESNCCGEVAQTDETTEG